MVTICQFCEHVRLNPLGTLCARLAVIHPDLEECTSFAGDMRGFVESRILENERDQVLDEIATDLDFWTQEDMQSITDARAISFSSSGGKRIPKPAKKRRGKKHDTPVRK